KTKARQALALFCQYRANALGALRFAFGRHQLQRDVVEREQRTGYTVAPVAPGWCAAEQYLVGGRARFDILGDNDDMVESGDHGNRPRVFLAARTFSTPIAMAAVRWGTLSVLARSNIWSKARSSSWYSLRVTSSSSQNNCCKSCTHSK